jgi:hypothetical protein
VGLWRGFRREVEGLKGREELERCWGEVLREMKCR